MTFQQLLVLFSLLGTVVGLAWGRWQPPRLFAVLLGFYLLMGFTDLDAALKNFVNPSVFTLVLLVICTSVVVRTRALVAVGQALTGHSQLASTFKLGGAGGVLSALVSNTAVVSIQLRLVTSRLPERAAQLMLPLSYAAILGGTMTLVGTSTNLLVNGLTEQAGLAAIGFFDFLPVGGVAFLVGMALLLPLSRRFLRDRRQPQVQNEQYFIEALVGEDSSLVGGSVEEGGLRRLENLFLAEIIRDEELINPVGPEQRIHAGDVLIFVGDVTQIGSLNRFDGLKIFEEDSLVLRLNLIEVVIAQDAELLGRTIKEANLRARFDASVVAMYRSGARLSGKLGQIRLRVGDRLVLAEGKNFRKLRYRGRNFHLLGELSITDPLPPVAEFWVLGGFIGAIGSAAAGWIGLLEAVALFTGALVASGLLRLESLRRELPLNLWITIGCALGVAQVLVSSGVGELVAHWVQQLVVTGGPLGGLIAIYLLTLVITEVATNMAAASIAFPVALALAAQFGVDPKPFIMTVAFAASASFLTPYGYQTNLMVYSAGYCTLADFLRLGLPLSIAYGLVVLILVPRVFPF